METTSQAPTGCKAARVIILTDAASGVGASTAPRPASERVCVVVNYRSNPAPAQAVVAVHQVLGNQPVAVQDDGANDADCEAQAATNMQHWENLDGLVNCVAITQFVPLTEQCRLKPQDFLSNYGTNIVGAFQMRRALCACTTRGRGWSS